MRYWKKLKITFSLLPVNKDSFCSGIHFYETAIIFRQFSKIVEILVKNVMKTADASKLFLAIFEITFYRLYICHCLWLQHISITSNNDRRCNWHCPPKKEL